MAGWQVAAAITNNLRHVNAKKAFWSDITVEYDEKNQGFKIHQSTLLRTTPDIIRMGGDGAAGGDAAKVGAIFGGIASAPRQLAQRLGNERIHLNANVQILDDQTLEINGKSMAFDAVVQAFNPEQAKEKRHVWTLHFDAQHSPLKSNHILLNGDVRTKNGLIAHLAVPSDVQPSYAPDGRSLVTITVVGERADALGLRAADTIETAVRDEVDVWFSGASKDWRLLAVQHIEHALPEVGADLQLTAAPRVTGFECGDHTLHGSVEGALLSAETIANKVDAHLRN